MINPVTYQPRRRKAEKPCRVCGVVMPATPEYFTVTGRIRPDGTPTTRNVCHGCKQTYWRAQNIAEYPRRKARKLKAILDRLNERTN
jgi:hypothetical protein